jgi:site-specific DNA-methyltransferase (adenine-specific)
VSAPRKPVLYGDAVRWALIEADALMFLAKLPEHSVDAIVTDPPYGIGFHGEAWDGVDIRRTARRSGERFGGAEAFEQWTRIWAGECRRVLKPGGYAVFFGAPRTFHRLTCGIEDTGLEVRDVLLWLNGQGFPKSHRMPGGVGVSMKPAYEPILLARAPFSGRLAENLNTWGTGVLNIDAARIISDDTRDRWPANVALSHAPACTETSCEPDCPVGLLDGAQPDARPSRFFYCGKATRAERDAGCEHLPTKRIQIYTGKSHPPKVVRNSHPTVKPLSLMRWLVRLTCPPGGLVLDPFAGSGSTGAAAVLEDRQFVGIEREPEYMRVARARLTHWAHESTKGPV